ncbi:MAG: bifunctional diguanylate cyclase/phosphodiesterase [Deltaproteobacteria bacterium]|jgi:diguanylate cyclase (GGDEF)-like protein|nr:bifunctional diguanylate cyclase/phosphodiesterase [Deltaproteobacteria bacterium]
MGISSQILTDNVNLLKSKASKYAILGVLIASTAIIIATILSSYFHYGGINAENIVEAQKKNFALWILDFMPFIFAFWGQYTSSIMAYEAGALVMDQTQELRSRTTELELQIVRNATYDNLTKLPNRFLLIDRLEQAIASSGYEKRKIGLIILNLNQFRDINETLGHDRGDLVLIQVASRLNTVIQEPDTLARMDSDEFAVLQYNINDIDYLKRTATMISKSLAKAFIIDGLSLDVRGTIGVALFPDHATSASNLLRNADLAMNVAKQDKREYTIYSDELAQKRTTGCLTLTAELRQAIEQNELQVYYQPKLNAVTGRVDEAEALVRWQHKRHGFIPPDNFIQLAERSSLIRALSSWVLNEVMRQSSAWSKEGIDVSLTVNLSSQDLSSPDLPDIISELLTAHKISPRNLRVEITETSLMINHEIAFQNLTRLAEMGIKSSIDDFGTGYSSLSYLKMLPASELKIDKSFVMDMMENENDAVIVRTIIDLAHNLGLKVVAEGVETKAQQDELIRLGCDYLQGYGICKPKYSTEFSSWLQQENSQNKTSLTSVN